MKPYLEAKAAYRMAKYDFLREAIRSTGKPNAVYEAALEMQTVREAAGLVDSDPDSLTGKVDFPRSRETPQEELNLHREILHMLEVEFKIRESHSPLFMSSLSLLAKERALVQRLEQHVPEVLARENAKIEPYKRSKERYLAACTELLQHSE